MSSSKGVGSSAKDMAELLPSELLRFLMLRTQPKTVINFAPNYETITRLFRDYDKLMNKYQQELEKNGGKEIELDRNLLSLFYSQLEENIKHYNFFDISTLISLIQIPHLELQKEIQQRTDKELNELDWEKINERIAVSKKWLEDYADEEEKLVIYFDEIPEKVKELTKEQINYLKQLKTTLETVKNWEGEELQTALFTASKVIEIHPTLAFPAVYYSFLGKEKGPKAGYLFSYLEREFVIKRLQEVINLS
jgi:lysyl-tRNA synthetase class 1